MKKYLLHIPLMLLPYTVVIPNWWMMTTEAGRSFLSEYFDMNTFFVYVLFALAWVVSAVFSLICCIWATAARRPARELTLFGLAVKAAHIPAYIAIFIFGAIGGLFPLFGLFVMAGAFILDVFIIALSGMLNAFSALALRREGRVSRTEALLLAVCGWIFVVDVAIAAVMHIKARRRVEGE